MHRLRLESGETSTVRLDPVGLLTDSLRTAGVHLNTQCGGRGVCRGCQVQLADGDYRFDGEPIHVTAADEPRTVRACQTRLAGGHGEIRVPHSSLLPSVVQVEEGFLLHEFDFTPAWKCIDVVLRKADLSERITDVELVEEAIDRQLDRRVRSIRRDRGLVRSLSLLLGGTADRSLRVVLHDRGEEVEAVAFSAPGRIAGPVGLAVDVGTTTLVAMLVDLSTGTIVGSRSGYNEQIRLADDVASRLGMAETPEQIAQMQCLVINESLNQRLMELMRDTGIEQDAIVDAVISGNTVMSHLFLGLSPRGIGAAPFTPTTRHYPDASAGELGLRINPLARVRVIPSISGYVGGDLVADVYAGALLAREQLVLLVDIGTNGEIILSDGERLLATSTAAGPAFEGRGTLCGMRATAGSIEHIRIQEDGHLEYGVIGGGRPMGLCGSAIVDFIAEAFRAGFILPNGRFDLARLREAGRYLPVAPTETEKSDPEFLPRVVHGFLIVAPGKSGTGRPIVVSEFDVAEVLKAKAAIYAGIKTMLAELGRSVGDIHQLLLAGGFARHLRLSSAVAIGLLPELPPDRYIVMGNGSLAGAYLGLVDPPAMATMDTLADLPQKVELNLAESFQDHYIDALGLPNLDEDEFPGVHTYVEEGAR